jgi:hypothetical protein
LTQSAVGFMLVYSGVPVARLGTNTYSWAIIIRKRFGH